MRTREIRIGSRGSVLALAQASLVSEAFAREDRASRIVVIETEGDRRAPDTVWGEGAFVAAIEQALLSGRVDVAVHSAKDIPTDEQPALRIGAYLPRADPRDALVVRDGAAPRLDDLPSGARVGTDSPRRTAFLLARRPDLAVHPLHGNVDTRLRRLDAGETDALVLACAGLDRMSLGDRIGERLPADVVPPAPGQGAVALQIRRADARMLALTAAIDHGPTRLAVEAERAFLAASGGGCRAPIGALAELDDSELVLLGAYADPDGSVAFASRRGPRQDGEVVARALAAELLTGASRGVGSAPEADALAPSATPRRVLVTRAAHQADGLLAALRDAGLEAVTVPTIAVELDPPGGDLDRCARALDTYAWVVITSPNGARAILEAAERVFTSLGTPRWAAIGSTTRAALEAQGIEVEFQPGQSTSTSLAADLPVRRGDGVLVVRGDLAGEGLAAALRARGAEVDDVVAYRTVEAPEASRMPLRAAFVAGSFEAVLFTSGSTVRGLEALARAEALDVTTIPAVCIGPATADEARRAGFRVLAVSATPDRTALVAATARVLSAPSEVQA